MSSPAEHQAFSAKTQEGTVGRTEEKEERRGGGEGKEWRGDVEERRGGGEEMWRRCRGEWEEWSEVERRGAEG